MTVGLEILWYFVVGIAMIAYTVLDGFDLGVGILHPFAKSDVERRTFLNAIGPVWDGNEVWFIIVGGALFAGFPEVYATAFSGFYNLCMCLIASLIFRAAAIEFRSQKPSSAWRTTWDMVFSISSLAIAFFIGLGLGNLVEGIPLDENHVLMTDHFTIYRPYSILVGIMGVALFTMHGAIFLVMKTEGRLQVKLKKWARRTIGIFIFWYAVTTWATFVYMPHMVERMKNDPYLSLVGLFALLAMINVLWQEQRKCYGYAFISSCFGIALFVALFGIGTYPVLIRSSINPADFSLTIFNSSSSALTLKVLMIIVMIGVPLVLAYGFWIYRIFRGKVKLGPHSY